MLLNWGRKWKTRVSAAGASSSFLPSRVLEIFSFALKNKPAPGTQVRSRVLHGNKVAFNKVLGITRDFLCLSNSKIYEKEPRYNETSL